jgi:hypothetical protein
LLGKDLQASQPRCRKITAQQTKNDVVEVYFFREKRIKDDAKAWIIHTLRQLRTRK